MKQQFSRYASDLQRVKTIETDGQTFHAETGPEGLHLVSVRSQNQYVIIPEKLEGQPILSLELAALAGCQEMKTLIMPAELEITIDENPLTFVPNLCIRPENLQEIRFINAGRLHVREGILYDRDICLWAFDHTRTAFSLETGCRAIAPGALAGHPNMESLDLPDSLEVIDKFALASLEIPGRLANLHIGANVTWIGEFAFFGMIQDSTRLYFAGETPPDMDGSKEMDGYLFHNPDGSMPSPRIIVPERFRRNYTLKKSPLARYVPKASARRSVPVMQKKAPAVMAAMQ